MLDEQKDWVNQVNKYDKTKDEGEIKKEIEEIRVALLTIEMRRIVVTKAIKTAKELGVPHDWKVFLQLDFLQANVDYRSYSDNLKVSND